MKKYKIIDSKFEPSVIDAQRTPAKVAKYVLTIAFAGSLLVTSLFGNDDSKRYLNEQLGMAKSSTAYNLFNNNNNNYHNNNGGLDGKI